jgi:uncharacterized protein (UPF0335 family)
MTNTDIRGYAERLVALENQKDEISSDISDLKKEAEGNGVDKKVLADTVRLMMMEADKRKKRLDQLSLFDDYIAAVG